MAGLFSPTSVWPLFFDANAASLILFSAGLISAAQVTDWRRRHAALTALPPSVWSRRLRDALTRPWQLQEAGETQERDHIENWGGRLLSLVAASIHRLGIRAVLLAALALFALLIASDNLTWHSDPLTAGAFVYTVSGSCLVLAFVILVNERRFATADAEEWPEAQALMLLARVPIVTLAATAFSLLMAANGYPWAARLPGLLACLSILVSFEFLIRAIIAMFAPQGDGQPPLLARSLVAGGLHPPPRPLAALQAELHSRSGIDLRQIWALTFVRRTFPLVAAGTVLVGWLMSGINEVPMTGRGIYERFGKPVSVVHPGLHAGLPWPFGRIVPVENGVVHELATSVAGDADPTASSDAEGPAPASADRLWDGSHVSEKSQIIASQTEGKQSFQIVNMDVRFVYRIGLSDQAAMDAAYRTTDVAALMEATASRVLMHDFAVRTLDDVLGQERNDMADEIAATIRSDLDRLHSGIEVLAVVVEAIHPPAGAANAYHAVQAAEITAQALVARERGEAARTNNAAAQAASIERDKVTATARESIDAANVERLRFAAEKTAYQDGGQAFLTEAYFTRLIAGLGHARALILDHRIGGTSPPTFDLRSMTMPIDPNLPGSAGTPPTRDAVKQ